MTDTDLLKAGWRHLYYIKRKQYYTHEKHPYRADLKAAKQIQKEWDNEVHFYSVSTTATLSELVAAIGEGK